MILNRKAEVSLHGQAAGVEFTLESVTSEDGLKYKLNIKDTSDIEPEEQLEDYKSEIELTITQEQAACIMYLFLNGDSPDTEGFYEPLESLNIPYNLRLYP